MVEKQDGVTTAPDAEEKANAAKKRAEFRKVQRAVLDQIVADAKNETEQKEKKTP